MSRVLRRVLCHWTHDAFRLAENERSVRADATGWRLAARSVDYLAEDSAPSPVQHYGSLAVEEQFYVLWPLLLPLVLRLRRGRVPVAVGLAAASALTAVLLAGSGATRICRLYAEKVPTPSTAFMRNV